MTPKVPKGGFFISKKKNNNDINNLKHLLDSDTFKTVVFPEENIVLAAFKEFDGQGLWHFSGGAVAYDTDLTNTAALKQFLDINTNPVDTGIILWHLYQKMGIGFLDNLRKKLDFAL